MASASGQGAFWKNFSVSRLNLALVLKNFSDVLIFVTSLHFINILFEIGMIKMSQITPHSIRNLCFLRMSTIERQFQIPWEHESVVGIALHHLPRIPEFRQRGLMH